MSNENSNLKLRTWYKCQPAHLRGYLRQQVFDELDWTYNIFLNKMNRTRITRLEKEKLNEIFNEKIFNF